MADFAAIDRYLDDHLDQSLSELTRYASQPSVAAQNLGMEECARLVAEMLRARGFSVEIVPDEGYPVVIAERLPAFPKIDDVTRMPIPWLVERRWWVQGMNPRSSSPRTISMSARSGA